MLRLCAAEQERVNARNRDVEERTISTKAEIVGYCQLGVAGVSWDGLRLSIRIHPAHVTSCQTSRNRLATSGGWPTAAGGVRLGKDSE
jgi:hypothetical protein